jgi:hypothetical protein
VKDSIKERLKLIERSSFSLYKGAAVRFNDDDDRTLITSSRSLFFVSTETPIKQIFLQVLTPLARSSTFSRSPSS